MASLSPLVVTASCRTLSFISLDLPQLVSGLPFRPGHRVSTFWSRSQLWIPNLNNHALALCAVRAYHFPSWSRYPSLTPLGPHEGKAFMGLHS